MKLRVLTLLLLLTTQLEAKVTMSSIWGDGMVLQRNQTILIGGTSDSKSVTVTPSWSSQSYTSKVAEDQQWGVEIPTIDAGGPYTITIDDGDKIEISNIMLGDIWLCMGQSNMQMQLKGSVSQPVEGATRYITQAKESRPIRLFNVARNASASESSDVTGAWALNNSKSAANFSAVGYMFACELESTLDIPIGLIECDWGGTPIEAWMNREWLSDAVDYDFTKIDKGETASPISHTSTYLFNGMVAPLAELSIKGILWYQGENNRAKYNDYLKYFPSFVAGLRDHFRGGEFPFYYVQIAPYSYDGDKGAYNGVLMREAMGKLMDLTPRTGMATTTDLGEENNIHPRYKREVSERLAYWALGDCYGVEGFEYRAAEYDNMEVVESKFSKNPAISLQFKYAERGLAFKDQKPSKLFEIAGEDGVFYPAQVKLLLSNDRPLLVWSDEVADPVAVRYAFKNYVDGDLYNSYGIALSSFRTDDWHLE